MSAAAHRTTATSLAVETAVANRKSASVSRRAYVPPRTPAHRGADSRRRSELSQLPNARGDPSALQEPPAGSPAVPMSRPNGRPFCCPVPSQTSVPSRRLLRTFILTLKQGWRLRAYESVPPKLYGGTERVVAWLTDELIDLGHRVTLFASGDSNTKADLNA